jgi:hypothetical protein
MGQFAAEKRTTPAANTFPKEAIWGVSLVMAVLSLSDLPLVLELNLQLFNYLGQPLSRKGVCGLQGKPAGLLQLSFQYRAPDTYHLGAPSYPEFSKMFTDILTIR